MQLCSHSVQQNYLLYLILIHVIDMHIYIRGAFKKFCNLTIKKNGNVTNYTLFFNIILTEFNACATFFWQTVNSTKIEIFCLSLQPLLDSFLQRFIIRIYWCCCCCYQIYDLLRLFHFITHRCQTLYLVSSFVQRVKQLIRDHHISD